MFGILDDIAVVAGEFFDDRQILGGIWLFAVKGVGFVGGVVWFAAGVNNRSPPSF
ncbi:MAG: hypothetical protein WCV63_03340 [Negativicutes bacterium]